MRSGRRQAYGERKVAEVLEKDGERVPKVRELECPDVFSVEEDLALLRVI